MDIIPPIPITDSVFTSSNVPETDEDEWSVIVGYVVDDLVMVLDTHTIYKCQAANTGKYPPDHLADGDPDADPEVPDTWAVVSATNRWKMWDNRSKSSTVQADSIIAEVTPGELFNTMAVINLVGVSANVTVTDPVAGEVYNHDVDLIDLSGINDFYDWAFNPLERISDFVLDDLPAYALATAKLTVLNTGSTAQVGESVVGRKRILGTTEHGTSIGIQNYSRKEVDEETGDATIESRPYAKTVNYVSLVLTSRVSYVQRILAANIDVPAIYFGDKSCTATIVFGFFKSFNIVLTDGEYSNCTLTTEELS